jgi:ABC-type transport system involved in cytochrome c biogenesis permease subunit
MGIILPAWAPFLIVVVAVAVCMVARVLGGHLLASRTWSAWQGIPGVMTFMPGGVVPAGGQPTSASVAPRSSTAETQTPLPAILDGATMVLMELFFVMLWTGIVMGAVWADHSWGRPWGWDPKEVFALNTWIIFLILVHVRLRVREKALWTAVLVVIGTSVMLFNWIVVNFFITGLHSYA